MVTKIGDNDMTATQIGDGDGGDGDGGGNDGDGGVTKIGDGMD